MVKAKDHQPKRGQIWVTDLNPGFGKELHKKRPAVIISSDILNKYSPTVIILPITSQVFPGRPDRVRLSGKESGLKKDSAVLTDQVRTVDRSRLLKKIGSLDDDKITEIEEMLMLVLGVKELD